MRKTCIVIVFSFFITDLHADSIDSCTNKIRKFAEEYSPNASMNESPVIPPLLSSDLVYCLDKITEKDKQIYVTLIFLKIYRAHLQCCNQSYDLRDNEPLDSVHTKLLWVFLSLNKLEYDLTKPIEFIPSSIAYDFVNKNLHLLRYDSIKKEYSFIKRKR